MITSPPSATTGSLLYMPLPAVQRSSYIGGITASTRSYGSSTHTMWRCDESIAACRQASCTSPQYIPATPSCVTTTASKDNGVCSSDAALLMTERTAESIVPITSYDVISAPSQCVKWMISGAAMPGNRYFVPPEKPATSWGKTGPQMSTWSYSVARRLSATGTS